MGSSGGPAIQLSNAGQLEEGVKNLAGYIVGQTLGNTNKTNLLDNWESFGNGVERDIGKPTRELFNIDGARDKKAQAAADSVTAQAQAAADATAQANQLKDYQSDVVASRAAAGARATALARSNGGAAMPSTAGKYLGSDSSTILGT